MHAETATWRAPERAARAELKVRGSRFLAAVWGVEDEVAAKAHLDALRAEFPRATHHCWGWRLRGAAGPVERGGDAGEPAGTAGLPIVRALAAADLEAVSAVVVRWFGGTKLGVGPLARAYRDAAAAAVEVAGVTRRHLVRVYRASLPYSDSGSARRALTQLGATVRDGQAGERAEILIRVPAGNASRLQVVLADATRGRAEIVDLGVESEPLP